MTSFRTPTRFILFNWKLYFCQHIAESANFAESTQYRCIFLKILGLPLYCIFDLKLRKFNFNIIIAGFFDEKNGRKSNLAKRLLDFLPKITSKCLFDKCSIIKLKFVCLFHAGQHGMLNMLTFELPSRENQCFKISIKVKTKIM